MSVPRFNDVNCLIGLLPDCMDGMRVLDLGCGWGYWGWLLKVCLDHDIYLVGVELDEERADKVMSKMGVYDHISKCDIRFFVGSIPDETFDVVILSHVIEHMPKEDGLAMIPELKRITKRLLLIPYPEGDAIGPLWMREGVPTNDWHVSVWWERDFRALGFRTRWFTMSSKAGRVVGWFERFWFVLRGLGKRGFSVAWWRREWK